MTTVAATSFSQELQGTVEFSDGSKFLYALSNGAHRIDAFRVNGNGSLTFLGSTPPLPAGTVSVAAD